MSRVGRLPIPLPPDVNVELVDNRVNIKGSKGELSYSSPPNISIALKGKELIVSRASDEKPQRALHGLVRSLLANMLKGVTEGFEKNLEIVGAGYRARMAGDKLVLQVGYTNPIEILPLSGTSLEVEGTNRIKVRGIKKELVGEMAARIRAVHPPDSYKGRGIRYAGEEIHLKAGKKAVGKRK